MYIILDKDGMICGGAIRKFSITNTAKQLGYTELNGYNLVSVGNRGIIKIYKGWSVKPSMGEKIIPHNSFVEKVLHEGKSKNYNWIVIDNMGRKCSIFYLEKDSDDKPIWKDR